MLKIQLLLSLEEMSECGMALTWDNIAMLLLDLDQPAIAREAAYRVATEMSEFKTEREALVGVPMERRFHLKLRFAKSSAGALKGSGLPVKLVQPVLPLLPQFRWVMTADEKAQQEMLHLCLPPDGPPLCSRRQAASKGLSFKNILAEGTTPQSMRMTTSRKQEGMCQRCLTRAPPAVRSAVLEALTASL